MVSFDNFCGKPDADTRAECKLMKQNGLPEIESTSRGADDLGTGSNEWTRTLVAASDAFLFIRPADSSLLSCRFELYLA